MKTIEIVVVDPKENFARLTDFTRRIDAGGDVPEATPHLYFTSMKQLFSAITEKRMEIIRYVAAHEGVNIRQLTQGLGRDYKNVYEDVRDLCEYGLLEKNGKGELSAPYDQIVIRANVREQRAA